MSTVCTFYAGDGISILNLRFENDVKMYGTQTTGAAGYERLPFENDVKMYGTQTPNNKAGVSSWFENDVKMYGTQTHIIPHFLTTRLRMM